jgi:hypothetical protein
MYCDHTAPTVAFRRLKLLYADKLTQYCSTTTTRPQAAACPPDPTKKAAMSTSFYRYFAAPDAAMPECQNATACVQNPACWRRLLGAQIRGVDTEANAVQEALRCAS